jgi:hypothetical protein
VALDLVLFPGLEIGGGHVACSEVREESIDQASTDPTTLELREHVGLMNMGRGSHRVIEPRVACQEPVQEAGIAPLALGHEAALRLDPFSAFDIQEVVPGVPLAAWRVIPYDRSEILRGAGSDEDRLLFRDHVGPPDGE